MKNSWVEVTTGEGQVVRGRLAGSDDTTATVVTKSGEVVPLQLRDAVALKQVAPPPPPPSAQPLTLEAKDADRVAGLEQRYGTAYGAPKGKKLHTAGAVVLSLGLTQVVIGVGLSVVSLIGGGDDVLGGAGLGLSESTAAELGARVQTRRSFQVLPKGAREALTIYDVVGITGAHELALPELTVHPRRLAVGAPARFTVLEGKDASFDAKPATLLSLDERGEAELLAAQVPEVLANIKFSLDGVDDEVAYAKVLGVSPDAGSFRVRLSAVPPRLAATLAALPWV